MTLEADRIDRPKEDPVSNVLKWVLLVGAEKKDHEPSQKSCCGTLIEGARFAVDSPLEGEGFEPSVPRPR
jgi:hypothetical protein